MPMSRLLPLDLVSLLRAALARASGLTITPKDIDGNPITDNGRPCGVVLDSTP